MTTIISIIFFVFGAIVGSFLNVVIYRYNTEKTLGGRSACMSCQNKLKWYDLVPIISFITLSGRCRTCKTKISIQYPIVELTSGFIFALLFCKFQYLFYVSTLQFSLIYAYYVAMFSLLLVIAVYDLKHKIIPDKLSLAFGLCTFIGLFFFLPNDSFSVFYPHIPSFSQFLAGLTISLPFAFFWYISKGTWIGFGDAKLAVGLGFLLGIPLLLSAIVISFWAGAIIGIILIFLSKKYGMRSEIPFAPFLVFGTMVAYIFGIHLFPL